MLNYAVTTPAHTAKKVALISIVVSAVLAVSKIMIGLVGRSTSVVADGVESAGDVVASSFVLFGLTLATRPADENHPYGHGRYETITGLMVGLILCIAGIGIAYRSLQNVNQIHPAPALYGVIPLVFSMVCKGFLSFTKFRVGKKSGSSALTADAWNDFVDIISAATAITALGLTLYDPSRFLSADHYGGFAVGIIVIFTGLRVAKDSTDRLTDAMPEGEFLEEIRRVALSIPGARGVEKCYARNTGLQYHVDLHLEVDPQLTVQESHDIATSVRFAIREQMGSVADVLVHVEPWNPNGVQQSLDSFR